MPTGWKDKHYALDMINWLNTKNVNMIEQPMPVRDARRYRMGYREQSASIIADESCQRLTDVPAATLLA